MPSLRLDVAKTKNSIDLFIVVLEQKIKELERARDDLPKWRSLYETIKNQVQHTQSNPRSCFIDEQRLRYSSPPDVYNRQISNLDTILQKLRHFNKYCLSKCSDPHLSVRLEDFQSALPLEEIKRFQCTCLETSNIPQEIKEFLANLRPGVTVASTFIGLFNPLPKIFDGLDKYCQQIQNNLQSSLRVVQVRCKRDFSRLLLRMKLHRRIDHAKSRDASTQTPTHMLLDCTEKGTRGPKRIGIKTAIKQETLVLSAEPIWRENNHPFCPIAVFFATLSEHKLQTRMPLLQKLIAHKLNCNPSQAQEKVAELIQSNAAFVNQMKEIIEKMTRQSDGYTSWKHRRRNPKKKKFMTEFAAEAKAIRNALDSDYPDATMAYFKLDVAIRTLNQKCSQHSHNTRTDPGTLCELTNGFAGMLSNLSKVESSPLNYLGMSPLVLAKLQKVQTLVPNSEKDWEAFKLPISGDRYTLDYLQKYAIDPKKVSEELRKLESSGGGGGEDEPPPIILSREVAKLLDLLPLAEDLTDVLTASAQVGTTEAQGSTAEACLACC